MIPSRWTLAVPTLLSGAALAVVVLTGVAHATPSDAGPVDLDRFLGRWYEQARTPNSFEDNHPRRDGVRYSACYGATAEYSLRSETEIRVLNECRRRGPEGGEIVDAAEGRARVLNPPDNTHLKVAFGPAVARAIQNLLSGSKGNYWIYAIGEPEGDGPYPWVVISGPDRDYIFVLSRERDPGEAEMAPALAAARAAGLPVDELIFRQLPPE